MKTRKFEELIRDENFMKAMEGISSGKISYKDWNPTPGFGEDKTSYNIMYLEYLEIYKHNYLGLMAKLGVLLTGMSVNPIKCWNEILEIERKMNDGFRYTMRIAKAQPKSEVIDILKSYKEGKSYCKEYREAIKRCDNILKYAKKTAC